MTIELAYSRPIATAARLLPAGADIDRFTRKRVLITAEPDTFSTVNGQHLLDASMRLLTKICRNVDVHLPDTIDVDHPLRELVNEVAIAQPPRVLTAPPCLGDYDAVLNLGYRVQSDRVTAIDSDGWLTRVSSVGDLPPSQHRTNAIGALGAASLGVADVFKRLLQIKPTRAPFFDRLSFSLFELAESEDAGPALAADLALPVTLIAGQGAIGNAIVYLLPRLATRGRVMLLDRQAYGVENLGTSVLLGAQALTHTLPKAEHNTAWLRARSELDASAIVSHLEDVMTEFGTSLPRPRLVITGFDNIKARHLVQELWPDVLVDGAIGDFACQGLIHVWGQDMACLKCIYEEPAGLDPYAVASEETGLSLSRVQDAEGTITQTDVDNAPSAKRELVRQHLGRTVCSMVSDAMRARISRDEDGESFAPSVPFVATLSGALMMAMTIRHLMGYLPSVSRYYLDALVGPDGGEAFRPQAHRSCFCSVRRTLIDAYRNEV